MTIANHPQPTCQELVELVTDYLEGALSPADAARVEEHLAEWPGCTEYLAQIRATIAATGSIRVDQVSPEARSGLLEAFRTWHAGALPPVSDDPV